MYMYYIIMISYIKLDRVKIVIDGFIYRYNNYYL